MCGVCCVCVCVCVCECVVFTRHCIANYYNDWFYDVRIELLELHGPLALARPWKSLIATHGCFLGAR